MRCSPCLLSVLWILLASSGEAATFHVPSEFATIQAGLDASASGDTVLVAPGAYSDYETRSIPGSGNVTAMAFIPDGVVVLSEGGRDVTELHHGTSTPVGTWGFWADHHATAQTRVEGFSVTSQVASRGGLASTFSSTISVAACRFEGTAGGIGLFQTDLEVVDTEFVNCQTTTAAGAGINSQDGRIIVTGCTFMNCAESAVALFGNQGGPVDYAEIRDCWFEGNSSSLGTGGAVRIQRYTGGVLIDGCTFILNTSTLIGGAAYITGDSFNPQIRECVFFGNGSEAVGGAMEIGANSTLTGCSFYGNYLNASQGGTAISFASSGTAMLGNCIVSATGGGSAIAFRGLNGSVNASCNVFWGTPDGIGITPSASDRIVDPQFCDAPNGDLTLQAASPCLPANSPGCGQVGALGEGCGAVSIERMSWGRIKAGFRN